MGAAKRQPDDLYNSRDNHSLESPESPAPIEREHNLACEQAAGEFIA